VEGNERADRVAKEAARSGTHSHEKFNSLAHLSRLITKCKWNEDRKWFRDQHHKRKPESRNTYKLLDKNQRIDPPAAGAKKKLACLFYQLKSGHAYTAEFLCRIGECNSRICSNCENGRIQTVRHLMLDCRKWRRERDIMWYEIKKANSTLRRNWAHLCDIFTDEKATAPILKLIQSTGIGRKYNEESEEQRNNFQQKILA